MGDETVEIAAGVSLYFPAGLVHGFRNTGNTPMQVIIVFPVPYFAETTLVETSAATIG
jgi:mannose-6-phosphate isomerase-like protein (cupin superfamily)